MEAELGSWESLREQFKLLDLTQEEKDVKWKTGVYLPRSKRVAELEIVQPLFNLPDPECDECHGAGAYKSTYNPNSKWDWYSIGGRWTGVLSDYDPQKDTDNIETCYLCSGTGQRPDADYKSCNGCEGKGTRLKLSSRWKKYEGDIAPLSKLSVPLPDAMRPFAILTPDGKWHEKGHMGWWGMVSDEKDTWKDEVDKILSEHRHLVGVVCDLHI
jgi:hypothetical protein